MSGQYAGWIPAPDFTEVNAALAKIANQLRGARMYGSAEIEEIKAQAWERGYLYSYYQERGYVDDGNAATPDHLVEDLAEWNPHRGDH